jgi:DNA polymerase-4
MERVILHSDLNNFYASVECLYNPEIRDKPVVVGGSPEARHGIVLAKNQIAKKAGIKTGEVLWQAKQKCPSLVIVRPNYSLYLRFSKMVHDIYKHYSDMIEPFGIDEAWVDVTNSAGLFGTGEDIAWKIKDRIKDELGITASIGVSYNKIFAKLGSDYMKPDAVTVITEDNFKYIVWPLPVSDLLYVGRATLKKLVNVGILTIGDLANASPIFLKKYLGKWGEYLWTFANGYDNSPVAKSGDESVIKGIGNSMTTPKDLICNDDAKVTITVLSDSVAERLRKHGFKCRTIQIYIRDKELESFERQAKLIKPTHISREISTKAMEIFLANYAWNKPIRSLGVRATDLVTADTCTQLTIFEDENKRIKLETLEDSIDKIRERFGHYSVQKALLLTDDALNSNPVEENIIFPVSYFK